MKDFEYTPQVSIGMPVCNGERYLKDAIDSLLNQDFRGFELIISDNASTDSTQSICRGYLQKDNRVRYYKNDVDVGVICNFNKVLQLARGKYFMWAACDDIWEPSFVSSLINKLEDCPRHILAFCKFKIMNNERNTIASINTNWTKYFDAPRFFREMYMIFIHYDSQKACIIYGLIRREFLLKIGGFYDGHGNDHSQGCDIVTLLRLVSYGPFVFIDKPLFHYEYREACAYQRKKIVSYPDFAIKNRFLPKVTKNFSQFKTDISYKPLNEKYYAAFKEVIKKSPINNIEKILLCICVDIEKYFEPSKIYKILLLYSKALFRKL